MITPRADMIQAYVYRRTRDGDVEYLLLQRSEDEELYPGIWQMVTGRIESGESAMDAARREIAEETSVDSASMVVVPYIASFYFPPDNTIHNVPVFAMEADCETAVRLSSEHQQYAWLSFDEAWAQLVFPGHREGLRILREYCLEDTRAREEY